MFNHPQTIRLKGSTEQLPPNLKKVSRDYLLPSPLCKRLHNKVRLVRPREYRLSDVEGVINTPKLGEHTNIEVIVDVVLRVVVMLRFIGR
jgi:hypothetical protein